MRPDDDEVENQQVNTDATNQAAVIRWIQDHAHLLATVDPRAPLSDLEPLRDLVRDATVIGLGRPTHGAHELTTLTHRILRFLVEYMGFRSLAVEEDWTKGFQIDEYLRTGTVDPRALLDDAWLHYRNEEVLGVLRWMRSRNERHPADPVRFVGVDISGVRALAYEAVADYVRRAAPGRLEELEAHYAALRPAAGIAEHTEWYRGQPDKQPFIDHAQRAYDLVAGLLAADGMAVALQHARAIVGFYKSHAMDSRISYVEPSLAENIIWWHEHTGHKIAYWGGFTHTAVGHARRVSFPPASPVTHRNAGSRLREHFGTGYVSVGFTFHHGSVDPGSVLCAVPTPSPGFADAILGGAGLDSYLLDLHADQPDLVRSWLDAPATMRLIGPRYTPNEDADNHMSGGTLAEWFDVIVHCRKVSPTRSLTKREYNISNE